MTRSTNRLAPLKPKRGAGLPDGAQAPFGRERLDAWDESLLSATALHPRLQQPMRVIDMAWFTAEHDDHHLARMTELARRA